MGSNPREFQIFISSVTFFLLCCHSEALEGPKATVVCIVIMLIKKDIYIYIHRQDVKYQYVIVTCNVIEALNENFYFFNIPLALLRVKR